MIPRFIRDSEFYCLYRSTFTPIASQLLFINHRRDLVPTELMDIILEFVLHNIIAFYDVVPEPKRYIAKITSNDIKNDFRYIWKVSKIAHKTYKFSYIDSRLMTYVDMGDCESQLYFGDITYPIRKGIVSIVLNPLYVHDIAIIGAGIAGYSAALLLTTFKHSPIIFGKRDVSHTKVTPILENYPGLPHSVTGEEFYNTIDSQIRLNNILVQDEIVQSVDISGVSNVILVRTDQGQYRFKTVLLATGISCSANEYTTHPLYGTKIFGCIACNPKYPDVSKKIVVVIGGGDNAVESAIILSKTALQVYVMFRSEMKASNVLMDQISKIGNIQIIKAPVIVSIDQYFVQYRTGDFWMPDKLRCDYVFSATSHKPVTSFVKDLNIDKDGYVVTRMHSTETNLKNIFACGIVGNPKYQTTTATIGSGAMAATDIMNALERYK